MTGSAMAKVIVGIVLVLLGVVTAILALLATVMGDPAPGHEAESQQGKLQNLMLLGALAVVFFAVGALLISQVYNGLERDTE